MFAVLSLACGPKPAHDSTSGNTTTTTGPDSPGTVTSDAVDLGSVGASSTSTSDTTSTSGTTSDTTSTGGDDEDCLLYEPPPQPAGGLYAPCSDQQPCDEDEGLYCFPFGNDFAFCTRLECQSDEECIVPGLDHRCDAKAKCYLRGAKIPVCFLECGNLNWLTGWCPEGMTCVATDLGPDHESLVCATPA